MVHWGGWQESSRGCWSPPGAAVCSSEPCGKGHRKFSLQVQNKRRSVKISLPSPPPPSGGGGSELMCAKLFLAVRTYDPDQRRLIKSLSSVAHYNLCKIPLITATLTQTAPHYAPSRLQGGLLLFSTGLSCSWIGCKDQRFAMWRYIACRP